MQTTNGVDEGVRFIKVKVNFGNIGVFTWEKVTTRSQVSVYRTNDPMETIAATDPKHDQDDRHTHIGVYIKKKQKKKTLCPVTLHVDSQVSDRCPWATCFIAQLASHFCFACFQFFSLNT